MAALGASLSLVSFRNFWWPGSAVVVELLRLWLNLMVRGSAPSERIVISFRSVSIVRLTLSVGALAIGALAGAGGATTSVLRASLFSLLAVGALAVGQRGLQLTDRSWLWTSETINHVDTIHKFPEPETIKGFEEAASSWVAQGVFEKKKEDVLFSIVCGLKKES